MWDMKRAAAAAVLREAEEELRAAQAEVHRRRPGSTRRYLLAVALERAAHAQALLSTLGREPPARA